MADTTVKKSDKRWQSDVIVDMIKKYEFEYIALNPGASYRGLHDSLVNYGENNPPMCALNRMNPKYSSTSARRKFGTARPMKPMNVAT